MKRRRKQRELKVPRIIGSYHMAVTPNTWRDPVFRRMPPDRQILYCCLASHLRHPGEMARVPVGSLLAQTRRTDVADLVRAVDELLCAYMLDYARFSRAAGDRGWSWLDYRFSPPVPATMGGARDTRGTH